MFVPAIGFIVVGVALSLVYALMFTMRIRNNQPADESKGLLGGWAGGSFFIGGGLCFILPTDLLWLVIPIAVVWFVCWWPVTYVIRRSCASFPHNNG